MWSTHWFTAAVLVTSPLPSRYIVTEYLFRVFLSEHLLSEHQGGEFQMRSSKIEAHAWLGQAAVLDAVLLLP